MQNIQEITKELPFWNSLSDSQKIFLNQNAYLKSFPRGKILSGTEKACLGLFYVVSGKIRVYAISEDGKEITLFNIEKAETCVLSSSCVIEQVEFDAQMVADEDCKLLIFGASGIGKLSNENLNVKCFVYEILIKRFSQVMEIIQRTFFDSIEKRLKEFLLQERRRAGSNTIKITQTKIAENINSAREVVARTMKKFEQEGLVETKRGIIILKDLENVKKS
ncbi:Crp/Fnr family transcriptional regulator [Treponema pectinovorum]|uniref:Crp/Fnr family transcriptional regulator n=1 Tax=Treponema pectinovorum TaxID=164 RepID=UPI0011CA6648|nr:Crp/Fnr family transcriptional regulator [Treponema pectinovorum]